MDGVAYLGSASKTLAPALRLGWLLLPDALVDRVALAKLHADHGSPTLDQLAFADFVERGGLDRHLRKVRPVYRRRRDALVASLRTHLPGLKVEGVAAGLHLMVQPAVGQRRRGPGRRRHPAFDAPLRRRASPIEAGPAGPAPRLRLAHGTRHQRRRGVAGGRSRRRRAYHNALARATPAHLGSSRALSRGAPGRGAYTGHA